MPILQKTFKTRLISVFLAFMILIVYVPSVSVTTVSADSGNVIPNRNIEFCDTNYDLLENNTIESGRLFYLKISIAENNANQDDGNIEDTYRVNISNVKFLLPNFDESGLKDGAEYSVDNTVFTLHIDEQGNRYIEFSIENGSAKTIYLQAKFAEGITQNGEISNITISHVKSGDTVQKTVSAASEIKWMKNKKTDKNDISTDNIKNGVTLNYTIDIEKNYSDKIGIKYPASFTVSDTLTLPNGMKFTDSAHKEIKKAFEVAFARQGVDIQNLSVSKTTGDSAIEVEFDVINQNTDADMSDMRFEIPVAFRSEGDDATVDMNDYTTEGSIQNNIDVKADGQTDISGTSDANTSVRISKASFSVQKSISGTKKNYYIAGDYITYEISAYNYGDIAGDITITDQFPYGLEYVSNNISADDENTEFVLNKDSADITFKNVSSGLSGSAELTFQISGENNGKVKNSALYDNGKKVESPEINIYENKASFEIEKSGYVERNGNNYGQIFYRGVDGQKAHYTIKVTNKGIKSGEVEIEDIISADISNPVLVNTIDGIQLNGNKLSGKVTLDAGENTTIRIDGDINTDAGASIVNEAYARTSEEEKSDSVEFTGKAPEPIYDIVKSADRNLYRKTDAGKQIVYTINVKNTGTSTLPSAVYDRELYNYAQNGDMQINGIISKHGNDKTDINVSDFLSSNGLIVDGLSIAPDDAYTFEIKVTILNDTISEYKNRAQINYGTDGEKTSNEVSVKLDDSADYEITKTIYDEKKGGYDSNDKVTFDVTFKNNSDDAIEDLRMYDASALNFIKELNKIEVIESDSQAYPVGTIISEINGKDYAVPWPDECFYVDFKGINLGTNGMIKLRYTASVKSNSSGDILNTVGFTSVHNSDFSSFDYGKAEVTVPRRDLNLTKQVYDSSEKEYTDSINVEINNGVSDIYTYKITLNGVNNSNNASYIGKTIHVKDVIPENMEYVDGSAKLSGSGAVSAVYSADTKTLDFEFVSISSLTASWDKMELEYQLKITDSEIVKDFKGKALTYTNTVVGASVEDYEMDINSSASVSFVNPTPAPGFSKEAYGSFAGNVYNGNLEQVGGIITAGDTLVWRLKVYNGTTTEGADKTSVLKDYTVRDNLPAEYDYSSSTGYKNTAKIYKINDDGTLDTSSEKEVNLPDTEIHEHDAEWNFSGEEYQLNPNECLVIEFATTANKNVEGVITNTALLTLSQNYFDDDLLSGTKNSDNTIGSEANYNIARLNTESYKTIRYIDNGHSIQDGDAHTDPETDDAVSRNPLDKYVQGKQGEEVEYELHIKNNSTKSLENFVFIDRMPFIDDKGLVSAYSRGSAFHVELGTIQSVTISDGQSLKTIPANKYSVSYSTDKDFVLNEYAKDWIGENDKTVWSSNKDNAVNFRVMVDSSIKIQPGEEIVLTFTGIVPNYVEHTGKSNIAWNSFAYAYQNAALFNDAVMIAESAKVGVWVATPENAIHVKVEKKLADSKGGTFFFALFDNHKNRISDIYPIALDDDSS